MPTSRRPGEIPAVIGGLQLRDGSLLVSDDFAGAVYRISYGE
jgi:hypothetical protein